MDVQARDSSHGTPFSRTGEVAAMTVLVTGGAGFIGSALVRHLIAETDADVVTVDSLTYAGSLDSLQPVMANARHHFERADVSDAATLRAILRVYQPTTVFHLAAESHVDRSIDAPEAFIRTNVLGTFELLRECRRHWESLAAEAKSAFRFIQVSTDEVYGSIDAPGRFHEASPYDPTSPYAASKAGADHLARAWHRTWGLPVIITNGCNTYGPYQFPEKLIPLTVRSALGDRPLRVYGHGENVRDWIHVDDHAAALLAAARRGTPGRSYLIGAGCERRNIDVVIMIAQLLDEISPSPSGRSRASLIEFVADRPGHDWRYAADASRAARELGWHSVTPLEQGLRSTVHWYLAHDAWCRRVQAGVYEGERLGLAALP